MPGNENLFASVFGAFITSRELPSAYWMWLNLVANESVSRFTCCALRQPVHLTKPVWPNTHLLQQAPAHAIADRLRAEASFVDSIDDELKRRGIDSVTCVAPSQ